MLRPVFCAYSKSMAGGRPTKYKPEFCEIAIECGKQGMGKAEIASKLGVVRETLWDWGNKKPEFWTPSCHAFKYKQKNRPEQLNTQAG